MGWKCLQDSSIKLTLTAKKPQQLINSSYPSYNYDVIDGLTYKFDLTQPNKYDREGKLVNQDVSRVRDLAYQGQPIDLNQTFICRNQ